MAASTKTLKFTSAGIFKTEETNVPANKIFRILMMYSNYAINISVIIGSMITAFRRTLQFISANILDLSNSFKNYF